MVRILEDLARQWRHLDERIEAVTSEIEALAKNTGACRHLMTIPGIGPIISSAVIAAIGKGATFRRGRDFAAWLGLVPRQMSTGDRTMLGRITKRGNRYLRTLIRRFLIHVLPSGFHRIRHYGLFANKARVQNIARARELLAAVQPISDTAGNSGNPDGPGVLNYPCPCCGGSMVVIETFERGATPRYKPLTSRRN